MNICWVDLVARCMQWLCVCVCDCECARLGPGVCSIHMQIVHIKSFLLHLNDNNVYNNNNNIRTHIIW